jgi:hypothetical protein
MHDPNCPHLGERTVAREPVGDKTTLFGGDGPDLLLGQAGDERN